jgi:hypothetical protein
MGGCDPPRKNYGALTSAADREGRTDELAALTRHRERVRGGLAGAGELLWGELFVLKKIAIVMTDGEYNPR